MKLFFKRKESDSESRPNSLSKGIQTAYKRMQGAWANWMEKRTKNFSWCTWLVLLILFVLSAGTYSIYLAVNAITGKRSNSITITPIKRPKHATETGETNKDAAEVSEAEYSRIKRFRIYMDSLARSPSGKILYDSITQHRPGLMDSVRFIENYYKQLNQK
jgi:hypothetical protein